MPHKLIVENIGTKGLASDPLPWMLPPEFITYGRNFKNATGVLYSAGGSQLLSTAPGTWYPAYPYHTGSASMEHWLVAGRDAIYAFDGTVWTDLTSVAGYGNLGVGDELLWTACALGQIPILNNPQAAPEYWAPQQVSQVMQPLNFEPGVTWAANSYTCKVMRSHKTFLFALNLTESGTELPDSYRWSHPADINGLPSTWDEADEAFLAGKASLGGDGGQIIDGESIRDAFAIYSEKAVDILDYTNDEYVWRRRELSSSFGLIAKGCLVEVKGTHYFMTQGDIMSNDGNALNSIIHDRLKRDYAGRIDSANYVNSYAAKYDREKEIWFCIPESGETYPTLAYVYNWKDDSWGIVDLPDDIATARQGNKVASQIAWDDPPDTETWDAQLGIWNSNSNASLLSTIMGANPVTGTLHVFIPDGISDNDFFTHIERTDFPLIDDVDNTTITAVYPHMIGNTPVTIQFGSQDYPGAPIRWKPAVVFNPGMDRKINIRTTGALHAWKFTTTGKILWGISGMTIEYEMAGKR